MADLIREEHDRYFNSYYYRCSVCGKECRYGIKMNKREPVCGNCQREKQKEQMYKKRMREDDELVNSVLDNILKRFLMLRGEISDYGYDDDSVRVYEAAVEIIEMFRR